MTTLRIDDIRRDGGTQPREKLDHSVIADYADDMERGDTFPPVKVMNDGENYWLYDGFHRINAAEKVGHEEVKVKVKQGTREDAVWASTKVNSHHGKRRSDETKRQQVRTAILHEKGVECSDNEIAKHCGVSQPFVGKVRRGLEDDSTYNVISQNERTGADGRTIDTSNIGGKSSNTGSEEEGGQKSLPTKPSGDGSPSKPSRPKPPNSSTSSGSSTTKPTRTKPDRSTSTGDADPDLTPPEPEPDEPPTAEDIVKQVCQHIAQIDISTGAIDAAKFMEDLNKFTDEQRERVAAQLRSTADRLATRADKIDPS